MQLFPLSALSLPRPVSAPGPRPSRWTPPTVGSRVVVVVPRRNRWPTPRPSSRGSAGRSSSPTVGRPAPSVGAPSPSRLPGREQRRGWRDRPKRPRSGRWPGAEQSAPHHLPNDFVVARALLVARPGRDAGLERRFAQFGALSMKLEQSSIGDIGDVHDGADLSAGDRPANLGGFRNYRSLTHAARYCDVRLRACRAAIIGTCLPRAGG